MMLRSARFTFLLAVPLLIPSLASAQKIALVSARESLSLRQKPSSSARRVESLLRYQPVRILERKTAANKKWARVKTIKAAKTKSRTGWVLANYLSANAFVSIDHDKVNVRSGPGTKYPVIMNYGRHYPLQVLDVATNGWLKVRDVDGDMGWLTSKLVKLKPSYVITTGIFKRWNVRAGVGTDHAIVFQVDKGYLFEVLKEKDGWLNVRDRDGDTGWMSSKIVFGWRDPKYPDQG